MAVCDKCWIFKTFGKKCYYYWEEKSTCSQFKDTPDQEPRHKADEKLIQL